MRRESIRGLSIYKEIRTKIWCQMAIEKTEYSAKCILQLSEKTEKLNIMRISCSVILRLIPLIRNGVSILLIYF